ncbi:16S rRNA (cytosine(1402)-N(4))-methyltransferase RsmH, partial [Actinomyces sp. MRS3W]|uniref:16S rRNA (cytosine(1402)-N(4))-methyltransferase RsmH n=1 Tax=Actinomyces sp. MRS3W TaxID=2800796 RepID=UPI0028FD0D95
MSTAPAANPAPAADAADYHTPVLLDRCLDLLAPALAVPDPVMIDCTLGMGGHTAGALERFPNLTVVGIDRDPQAIALATARMARFGRRFRAVATTYDAVDAVARDASRRTDGTVDAILMDLGVSSLQLDAAARGFSYARRAPLDMRMDQSAGRTAQDILDSADERELEHILRAYGEERFAARIAAAIVRRRADNPVTTTDELADLVREAIPAAARRSGGNPAKRTFQALRIAVNSELELLERALPRALNALRVGGRLVVESYQSLEDRLVKQVMAAGASPSAPADLPIIPAGAEPYLELVTHGAEKADAA